MSSQREEAFPEIVESGDKFWPKNNEPPSTKTSRRKTSRNPAFQLDHQWGYRLRAAQHDLDLLLEHKDVENITWISFDLEFSFYAPKGSATRKVILEVGSTWVYGSAAPSDDTLSRNTYHYIVKEYEHHHNKAPFVGKDEYNHKNNFLWVKGDTNDRRGPRSRGRSYCMPLAQIGPEHQRFLDEAKSKGPVVVVVHGGGSDLDALRELGCDLAGVRVVDTQSIDQALFTLNSYRGAYRQPRSLKALLAGARFEAKYPFHNAGNDAFYTMKVFTKQLTDVKAKALQLAQEPQPAQEMGPAQEPQAAQETGPAQEPQAW